jgi:hypothetical protein
MANNGIITPINYVFTQLERAKGVKYTKIIIRSPLIIVYLTI